MTAVLLDALLAKLLAVVLFEKFPFKEVEWRGAPPPVNQSWGENTADDEAAAMGFCWCGTPRTAFAGLLEVAKGRISVERKLFPALLLLLLFLGALRWSVLVTLSA